LRNKISVKPWLNSQKADLLENETKIKYVTGV
jgi:hypothetical protein